MAKTSSLYLFDKGKYLTEGRQMMLTDFCHGKVKVEKRVTNKEIYHCKVVILRIKKVFCFTKSACLVHCNLSNQLQTHFPYAFDNFLLQKKTNSWSSVSNFTMNK